MFTAPHFNRAMKRYFQLTFSVLAITLCLPAFGADATFDTLRPQTTDLQSEPALLAKIARALADQTFGGFGLVTNLILAVDTTSTGIVSGDVLAPVLEVRNAVRTTAGTGFLKCIRYAAGDNNAPAVRLLITSQPILDWPVTNAVMSFNAFTNNPYVLGGVDITTADFRPWGTNYYATKDCSFGISAATNSIFIYAGCSGAITNTNSASVKLYILQD